MVKEVVDYGGSQGFGVEAGRARQRPSQVAERNPRVLERKHGVRKRRQDVPISNSVA